VIYLLGDVHGNYDHILPAIENDKPGDGRPPTVIFLGDVEPQKPFEDEIRPLLSAGAEVWFIQGNHDTDSRQTWDNLLPSWHRNLNGRVVVIEGLRVAGLGGVFRGAIWNPALADAVPRFRSFGDYEKELYGNARHAHKGQLRKHSSTIFPDVYEALASQRADILVTHEAPSCHPHGFEAIDALARKMGIQTLFHGHHHDSLNYAGWTENLGFRAHGVGFCGISDMLGGRLLAGDFDEGRRYREQHPL
jgi:predicted phosphodiesterase